jgi:hypothetical protein
LSLSVERLGDGDYFNPRSYWFLDNDGLHADHPVGYANNASLFRRAAFEGAGGYPSKSLGADAALDVALSGMAQGVGPRRGDKELRRGEWFYIYRWGSARCTCRARVRKTSMGKLASSRSWKRASSCRPIGRGTTWQKPTDCWTPSRCSRLCMIPRGSCEN